MWRESWGRAFLEQTCPQGSFAPSGDWASLIPAHTWVIPRESHCGVQGIVIPRDNYAKALERPPNSTAALANPLRR